jgi:hypothetical protein
LRAADGANASDRVAIGDFEGEGLQANPRVYDRSLQGLDVQANVQVPSRVAKDDDPGGLPLTQR